MAEAVPGSVPTFKLVLVGDGGTGKVKTPFTLLHLQALIGRLRCWPLVAKWAHDNQYTHTLQTCQLTMHHRRRLSSAI